MPRAAPLLAALLLGTSSAAAQDTGGSTATPIDAAPATLSPAPTPQAQHAILSSMAWAQLLLQQQAELAKLRAQIEGLAAKAQPVAAAAAPPPPPPPPPPALDRTLDRLPPIPERAITIVTIRGHNGTHTATLRLADGSETTVAAGAKLPGDVTVTQIDRNSVLIRSARGAPQRLAFAAPPGSAVGIPDAIPAGLAAPPPGFSPGLAAPLALIPPRSAPIPATPPAR